jgi:hypothetical protein
MPGRAWGSGSSKIILSRTGEKMRGFTNNRKKEILKE